MDGFGEWLLESELNEGLVNNPLTRRTVKGLWDWVKLTGRASLLQAGDIRRGLEVLRRQLNSVFTGTDKPTPEQLQVAWKAISEVPKVGAVIISLISPVPGVFTGVMVAAIAIKRVFNFSILPTHFEQAWLPEDSFLGRMARPKPVPEPVGD